MAQREPIAVKCSGEDAPSRIVVDATHTLLSGLNTGVQRVVKSISRIAPEISPCKAEIVEHRGSDFRTVPPSTPASKRKSVHEIRSDVLSHCPQSYVKAAETVCRALPLRQVRRWLLPGPGHQGVFRYPLKLYERFSRNPDSENLALGARDILLLPDAYWAYEEIWPAIREAKQRGAFVASVVYDLIPLTHPDFVAKGADRSFTNYLHRVATHSDLIVAISDTVRDEVRETLPRLWPNEPTCRDIRSFELGAEFQSKSGFVRKEIQEIFSPTGQDNPYLMVSTFDPRKNHAYLLDAFEEIWKQAPNQKLCFIGRVGWLCKDIVERIWSHPRYGKQLFSLHDVSDAELNHCYQTARAICFPSKVEGFGLPIVEALWYQRHVFASDTPIHREVGREECTYCELEDPTDLAHKILAWEANLGPQSPIRQSSIKPISWKQSIQVLLNHCIDSYMQQERRAATHPSSTRAA